MGLLSRLVGTASRAARTTTRPAARRPVARRRTVARRPVSRRGTAAGGLMGAVRGFLRGSGRTRRI